MFRNSKEEYQPEGKERSSFYTKANKKYNYILHFQLKYAKMIKKAFMQKRGVL